MHMTDLLRRMGALKQDAERFAPLIDSECNRHEIFPPKRLAHFLGQIMHESANLRRCEESLHYRAERLMVVWPSRFPTLESAKPYADRPMELANKVYANRLGNGNEASGDGFRFRGRGLIQITGRANYEAFFAWAGLPADFDPNLVKSDLAVKSAVWFWVVNGLNDLADTDSVRSVTRRINGGLTGLSERRKKTEQARALLGQ